MIILLLDQLKSWAFKRFKVPPEIILLISLHHHLLLSLLKKVRIQRSRSDTQTSSWWVITLDLARSSSAKWFQTKLWTPRPISTAVENFNSNSWWSRRLLRNRWWRTACASYWRSRTISTSKSIKPTNTLLSRSRQWKDTNTSKDSRRQWSKPMRKELSSNVNSMKAVATNQCLTSRTI